jgi:hypothetical protein
LSKQIRGPKHIKIKPLFTITAEYPGPVAAELRKISFFLSESDEVHGTV